MLDDAKNLPNDPSELKELVVTLAAELKSRDMKIADLQNRLAGTTAIGSAPRLRAWINFS